MNALCSLFTIFQLAVTAEDLSTVFLPFNFGRDVDNILLSYIAYNKASSLQKRCDSCRTVAWDFSMFFRGARKTAFAQPLRSLCSAPTSHLTLWETPDVSILKRLWPRYFHPEDAPILWNHITHTNSGPLTWELVKNRLNEGNRKN